MQRALEAGTYRSQQRKLSAQLALESMNVAITENRFSSAGIVLEASSQFYFSTEWMNNFVVAVTEAH